MTPTAEAITPVPRRRDAPASALLAVSLLVHAAALAILLRPPPVPAAKPPAEIPVDLVQMPAEKPAPPPTKAADTRPASPPQHEAKSEPAEKPAAKTPSHRAAAGHPAKAAVAASRPAAAAPSPPPHRAETLDAPARDVAQRMQQLLGPMPAAVMPTAAAGDNPFDDAVSYRQMVLSQVARQRREDRHNGVPGHVVVAFTVGDAGEVVTCAVREKSVDPLLDSEAVAMVYRGAPYPPPPPGAGRAFSFGLAFRPTT